MLALRSLPLAFVCASAPSFAQQIVVPANTTLVYDTSRGPVHASSVHIQAGATVRIEGPDPFVLIATGTVTIDGLLDVSGHDALDVATLNNGNVPVLGAEGAAGGGNGGTASWVTTTSTPIGRSGAGPFGVPAMGGLGGESGMNDAFLGKDRRRPGGGGGGRLAADQPIDASDLDALVNLGLVARGGRAGFATSLGAISGASPSRGGAPNAGLFVDGDPSNDFFGRALTPAGVVQGELSSPSPGFGGGAGGDALPTTSFPSPNWNPGSDEQGAGGGGGGGLAGIFAAQIVLGPSGRVRADGGDGGAGENYIFLDHIGGSSGGGSGGYLILHAPIIDVQLAGPNALTALGGAGGIGEPTTGGAGVSNGGNGGPGVVQLHSAGGQGVLTGATSLDQLSSPDAYSLLPLF